MSGKTKIEWADVSWNPVTGCTKVSAGCKNCYAERMSKRLAGRAGYPADEPFRVTLHPEHLNDLRHWRKPRRIFVNSMGDLFHEDVPDEFIWQIFDNMTRGARRHTYMILTKRPERMKAWFDKYQERFWHYHAPGEPQRQYVAAPWPDPCLWLGVTAENQQTADERIPLLLETPAAVRFVSVEPMLGPVDIGQYLWETDSRDYGIDGPALDWVICGGETGPGARPMHYEWPTSLQLQCRAAEVPFFFKSWGEYKYEHVEGKYIFGEYLAKRVGKKASGRILNGREWNEFPEVEK